MHQVKIFKGIESDTPAIEKQINSWLAEETVRVVNIFGNIAPQSQPADAGTGSIRANPWPPSDILVIVHYEK